MFNMSIGDLRVWVYRAGDGEAFYRAESLEDAWELMTSLMKADLDSNGYTPNMYGVLECTQVNSTGFPIAWKEWVDARGRSFTSYLYQQRGSF